MEVKEEKRLRQLLKMGYTVKNIEKILDRSGNSVRGKMRILGLSATER